MPAAPAIPSAPAPAAPPGGAVILSAELGEALATTAELVAGVSDRMDGQAEALVELAHAQAQTHAAALAARPDPGRLAAEVEDAFSRSLAPQLRQLTTAMAELNRTAQAHGEARNRAEGQVLDMKRDLRAARADAMRWKGYLPGVVAGSLLLALLLGLLAVPRVLTRYPTACGLGGGVWSADASGQQACVLWAP